MPIRALSVEDIRKAADPVTAPKLLLLRGSRSFEDEETAWLVDQVTRRLRSLIPDIEIMDLALPSYRILSHVSNDPEDTLFAPEDQMPLVLEALRKADTIIVSSGACCGFPDCDLVRLFHRLVGVDLGASKVVAVVVHGDESAFLTTLTLEGAILNKGFVLARKGICWDKHWGDIVKAKDIATALDEMAASIVDLHKAVR